MNKFVLEKFKSYKVINIYKKYTKKGGKMVKVTIELSKHEIGMFINCIEAAIDTKHMRKKFEKRAVDIKKQLVEYL